MSYENKRGFYLVLLGCACIALFNQHLYHSVLICMQCYIRFPSFATHLNSTLDSGDTMKGTFSSVTVLFVFDRTLVY